MKEPIPAMTPLHPDKPEPEIVIGAVWRKKKSGKTSVNATMCRIVEIHTLTGMVTYELLANGKARTQTLRVFRRDWEPC